MIEFSGSYYQFPTSKGLSVLVQFDGDQLHIWHAPEPLFRIAACSSFRVTARKGDDRRSITLPNGARIDTDDRVAEDLAGHFGETNTLNPRWWQRSPWILVILTGITLLFGVWVLTHADTIILPV
jgi:hypothetical protein